MAIFQPLTDSDYFWHLKTGEYILAHHALPKTDIFSYTQYGKPWELHEWLFEVMLYQVWQWAGGWGVRFMTSLLATLSLLFAYLAASRLLKGSTAALVLLLIVMVPFSLGISPRPQLMTYLLFSAFLYVLSDFKYFQGMRALILLPVLMVLWVNVHGGYIVGIALLLLFSLCEWANYGLGGTRDEMTVTRLKRLSWSTAATILASLANPYFVEHWLYPFRVMGMNASRNYISEWRSPDFHDPHTLSYLFLVGIFFAIDIYRRKKPDATEFVLPSAFIAASFYAVRHIPLAALLLLVFGAAALHQGLFAGSLAGGLRKLQRRYASRITAGRQLGNVEYAMNWMFLGIAMLSLLFYAQAHRDRPGPAPAGAAQFVLDSGLRGRMFNSYDFGGYLIYKLYPAQRVFIDGRADLYGDAFIDKSYRVIAEGKPGWEKALDGFGIDYVVCEHDSPLRAILLAWGRFRLVYDDAGSSVLVRNIPRYAGLIAKYGK